jgi:hypothetical protein
MRLIRYTALLLTTAMLAGPALARPGGWGGGMGGGWGSGWGGDPYGRSYGSSWDRNRAVGPAEGKVEVSRFIAEDVDPASLAKGSVVVSSAPVGDNAEERELHTYESAVLDRLAGLGYQTATTDAAAGQVAELRVTHATVLPEEAPHKPVSGEMEVGVSNHGTMMGMGINIDLTKPAKALISTRLEARIKDKVSGKVLWEGRADIITREGSAKWNDNAISARLAKALFDGFPGKSGETRTALR